MKKILLLLAAVGTIFTACQGGLDNEENGGTPSTPKIELSQQTIDVGFEAATYSVSVTSPYSWKAVSDNDWIEVETATGIAGTKELKFSVSRNEVMESREGTIVIKNSDYNLIAELYVIQKAFVPEITIQPESLTFGAEDGAQDVTITANFEYEVTASVGWVTYEKTDNGIKVTVPTYTEVEERTAEVVVSSEKYGVSRSIKVTQGAFVPEITIEPESLTFAAEGETQEVVITANFNYYDVTTTADWITYKKTNRGIAITASANPTTEQRRVDVIFYNDNYRLSAILTVTQQGREKSPNNEIWYTSSDGSVVKPYKTGAFGANIVSNTYANGKGVIVFDAPVTSIGDSAFHYCTSLTSITIPDSVTSIGDNAFRDCTSLTSVTIPDSVTSIGEWAFYYCTSLISVTIPDGVTSIGYAAFYECTSLTSITIPDIVTSIGNSAFSGCTSLTSITIPDSVTKIGHAAFWRCTSLTSVTIGNSVTSIGGCAFYHCTSLTSVTIPDSVTSIGYQAFYNCTLLTSVTIGNSVTLIEYDAFCDCTSLTSVYCKPTTPPAGHSDMFYSNASGRKIYVPRNSVSAYKSAEYWSDYASYIEGYDF